MSRVTLRKIFGSEMAQEDPDFLSYAMPRNDYLLPLSDEDNKAIILNAARGSGKSGLLISLSEHLKGTSNTKIISLDYRDMVFPVGKISVNESINYWKNTILSKVVAEIGTSKGWAFIDDDICAVELSENYGVKSKNLLTSILSRLKFKSSPIERCQFDSNITIKQLSRIISASSIKYWIMLDEMDDIYDNGDEINLLIGLLQVVAYLGVRIPNIWVRVTIRPHILTLLRTTNGTIQKLNEYELNLSWSKEQIKEVLARRLDFYQRNNSNEDQLELTLSEPNALSDKSIETSKLISTYFEDFDMGFSVGSTSNYRAFGTLCFYRPRWLIEYCKEVRKITTESKRSNLYHYKRAFLPFGNRRIQFISGEFSKTIHYIHAALNALIALDVSGFGTSKKFRSVIVNQIIKTGIVQAEEHEYHRVALDIAKNLYITEFVRGKVRVDGAGGYHRFYYYNDRPDLLSSWQQDKNIHWEIHPTFQRAFDLEDSQVYKISEDVKIIGNKHQDKEGAT
ncbi:P-loop ATPase, Sll1717 family [Shewanella woodyi]|uniref:Uncharacterized protein n=1 Tax=Shewanella woodyi (strain ATCC 51908 / MS32) TaxID=392500 RepID=B1KHZ8_SHEWM|nr:hypothetical protein [Shewanella woodyi]ACA85476.1 hypothetical protein Swoo_1183 [Shewanella woodyi ATCC 51908]